MRHASIRRNKVLLRVVIGLSWGLLSKFSNVVRPIGFRRCTQCADGFDPVADLGAAILTPGAFNNPLIIIYKESRRYELLATFLALVKLDGSRDAMGGTAPQLALVVDWRAFGSQ